MEGGAVYTVTRYNCGDPKDEASVAGLSALAKEQQDVLQHPNPDNVVYLTRFQRRKFIQPFDSRVMPWTYECTLHTKKVAIRHYVAQMSDGRICGWMSAEKKTRFGVTYIYLSEISTIRVRKDEYKGVADALLGQLRKDAESEQVDFVYLYPLREDLVPVYEKRGYLKEEKLVVGDNRYTDVRHMFLFIKGTKIPDMMLILLKPEGPGKVVAEAEKILTAMKGDAAKDLLMQLKKVHLNLQADKTLVEELRNANDNIGLFEESGTPLTDDEKLDSIKEIVDVVPEKGPMPQGLPPGYRKGGRRTRRAQPQTKKAAKKTCYPGYEVYNFRKNSRGVFYNCLPKKRKTRRSRRA
jgi:hypothetical protein